MNIGTPYGYLISGRPFLRIRQKRMAKYFEKPERLYDR